uniref:Myb/SANT-like domain-containing protein n=1 Tax=Hordeum vulgare subsp. vulgare TaxID=112509 RepID=A0A8I6XQT1_HORVV
MMLKEARKQSGVGWDDKRCMIEADTDLWDNLMIVSSLIPPFDMVTNLYHANTHLLLWFFVVISKYREIQEEIFSSL